jgi:hypothetical protein
MKTKHLILCGIFTVLGIGATKVNAQSTTSPDTVCAGKTGASYYVAKTAGSTFKWVVPNGTIASGTNTDSITVNWSTTTGTDTIKVVEINKHGCYGDTQKLAVYRMPLPTASLSGTDTSTCQFFPTTFQVAFTGIGPWNFTYSDGTTSTTVNNVSATPYTINTGVLSSSKTYTITAISNKFGCNGTTAGSGSHVVTIHPKPTTSAIRHK